MDEVQRIVANAQANRDKLRQRLHQVDNSPLRSPLKERNAPLAGGSARRFSREPSEETGEVSKPSSATRLERESSERSEVIRSRSPLSRSGSKETYTKTTITEKEEKFHQTEVIKFTETSHEAAKEKLKTFGVRFAEENEEIDHSMRGYEDDSEIENVSMPTSQADEVSSTPNSTWSRTTPVKSPFKSSTSYTPKSTPVQPLFKPSTPYSHSSSTPIVTSSLRTVPDYDEEVFGASGRKKRLAALAQKFQHYKEDDPVPAQTTPENRPDESDLNVTKEIDVDEELAAIDEAAATPKSSRKSPYSLTGRSMPAGHTPTKNLGKDEAFLNSLKAQGFEETTSKSKLVYDFNKSGEESRSRPTSPYKPRAPTILSSPTRNATEPRSSSPHKPHPLQFVSPQVNREMSSPRARPSSPTKAPNPRPTSPYKPHPLQFVSPLPKHSSHGNPDSVSRPPKPSRTWAFSHIDREEAEDERKKTWKTETTLQVTPLRPPHEPRAAQEEKTDTASRRSISEKKNLFESTEPSSPTMDPAMLSMSERRALFEKHRTAPKPMARFGDAVTPSMLNRGQDRYESRMETKKLFTPSRPKSPIMGISPKRVASPVKAPSPKRIKDFVASSWEHTHKHVTEETSVMRPPSPPRCSPPRSPPTMRSTPPRSPPTMRPTTSPSRSPRPMRSLSPARSSPNKCPPPPPPKPPASPEVKYPGVGSLKKVKVSPPKPGQLYPQVGVESSSEDERPGTAMSETSSIAASEAPSLGASIQRAANVHRQMEERRNPMPSISESPRGTPQARSGSPQFRSPRPAMHQDEDDDDDMSEMSGVGDIDDMLDEALDDSYTTRGRASPRTSPKRGDCGRACSPSASAGSWEFATPQSPAKRGGHRHDFKTPLVGQNVASPERLPHVEGADNHALIHTVSFYRKQKPVTPHQKIVRGSGTTFDDAEADKDPQAGLQEEIKKLHEEAEEQRQRMEQASKALNYCVMQNEFEGSSERVEGERLLLESTHKYSAASAEIRRLSTLGSIGESSPYKRQKTTSAKGQIAISGLALPFKSEFVRMIRDGGDDTVHYFIVLVKHKSRVIPTQMLCTGEGISKGKLVFPNLINLRDLDFDFQIHIEVYGLQTRREHVSHEVKYHIRKEKSMFNLTPLKKMKKQESKAFPRNQNPVNSKTIRRPAFGMVGYSVINIQTLKNRAFHLDKVPALSPLAGGLEMTLTIHSENRVEQRGFLTMFTDVHGYGDWCRRWVLLSGNGLHFWKYPEDESKGLEPTEQISLSHCSTEEVSLAPKEICSRMNTLMLETRRSWRQGDEDSLVMKVNRGRGETTIRHLLSADTRDERMGWCKILNRAMENIRAWDPTAMRPRSESAGSRASADSGSTEIW